MLDEAIFLSASLFSVLLMSLALIYALFNVSNLLKVGFIYFFQGAFTSIKGNSSHKTMSQKLDFTE